MEARLRARPVEVLKDGRHQLDAHRAAARAQRHDHFEYSQFAGVWTAHSLTPRTLYCERCEGATIAPAATCTSCGAALDDSFLRDPSVR